MVRLILAILLFSSVASAQVAPFVFVPSSVPSAVTVTDTTKDSTHAAFSDVDTIKYRWSDASTFLIFGSAYQTGLLFDIAVPQGATIDSAILYVWHGTESITSAESVKVRFFAVDNVPIFEKTTNHTIKEHAALGLDSVWWDPPDDATYALERIDVTVLVDSVVSRSGWTEGNLMGFALLPEDKSAPSGWAAYMRPEGVYAASSRWSRLKVTYRE